MEIVILPKAQEHLEFWKKTEGKTYARNMPIEQIAIDLAEKWQDATKPGGGIFFDFKATSELEKPILDYLVNGFGWTLERPNFIRKTIIKK